MRITDLLSTESIALDFPVENQTQVIDKLISLQVTHGNITDVAAYKKAIYAREAEASTYADCGITVPHAKCNCVTKPSLAVLRPKTPVQYNPNDAEKSSLFFMIAVPNDNDLHVHLLARMMQMLMNKDFVAKLHTAKTPKEFLSVIDAQEEAQFGDESIMKEDTSVSTGYRVLAVTLSFCF